MGYIKREWSLTIYSNKLLKSYETYYTADECIWRMCDILHSLHMLDMATTGYISLTKFDKTHFVKRYVVYTPIPEMEIIIHKKSGGELDEKQFKYDLIKTTTEYAIEASAKAYGLL